MNRMAYFDEFESDTRVFHETARKNGWLYKQGRHQVMHGKREYGKDLTVQLDNHEFDKYPYLDTLKFLNEDGVLSNKGTYDDKWLTNTDGGWDHDD